MDARQRGLGALDAMLEVWSLTTPYGQWGYIWRTEHASGGGSADSERAACTAALAAIDNQRAREQERAACEASVMRRPAP